MEHSTEIVAPTTGVLVDLSSPAEVAHALHEIRDIEDKVKDFKRVLTHVLVEEAARQGAKTIELGGLKVVIKEGEQILWDVDVLEDLLEAGLPQERFDELVKVECTHKVSKREADRIAAGRPEYAEIIETAKTVIPRVPYATIEVPDVRH